MKSLRAFWRMRISLASLLPDREISGIGVAFAGHFYDPDTHENYLGSKLDTASRNATKHYNRAVNVAKKDDLELMCENLGKCLHYIQDSNVPHHAANVVSYGDESSHAGFEKYAFEKSEQILGNYQSVSANIYTKALTYEVESIVYEGAVFAKSKINTVNGVFDESVWYNTADACLKKATEYSVMLLYKFAQEDDVVLYSK